MSETSLKPAELAAIAEQSSAATLEKVESTFERFLQIASVKSVYTGPVQHGDKIIIPAAEVLGTLGFGLGSGVGVGESPAKKDGGEGTEGGEVQAAASQSGPGVKVEGSGAGGGGGGGGGGYILTRPVAVIVSGPEGVKVEPVVDVTKVALAFFTAFGFMFSMALRMRRPPRS